MAKSNKLMKSPKPGTVERVDHVRISSDKPNQTVKFKQVKEGVVRATARGEAPMFIKQTEKGFTAGVRGEAPVAAKTADQAFSKAVRRDWA